MQGKLVYVNYGRLEDFIWLSETKHLNISGHICIAKYGKNNRGDKVRLYKSF